MKTQIVYAALSAYADAMGMSIQETRESMTAPQYRAMMLAIQAAVDQTIRELRELTGDKE